jgi:hypothetical protein
MLVTVIPNTLVCSASISSVETARLGGGLENRLVLRWYSWVASAEQRSWTLGKLGTLRRDEFWPRPTDGARNVCIALPERYIE